MTKKAASLSPEDFVIGGGLIDDVVVTFQENRFELFDYGGTIIPGVPALGVTLVTEEGDESKQYYSVGSSKDWRPSEDGKELIAVGGASERSLKAPALRSTSNLAIFLQNLVDAGFPIDNLGTDISVMDGLKAHVIQIPAPERKGLKKKDKRYDDTILVVDEIIALPGEKASKTKAKGKAKAKGEEGGSKSKEDLEAKAQSAVMQMLAEAKGNKVNKTEIPASIFKTFKEDPDRNEIIAIAFNDDFLAAGPWTYKDGILSL